MRYGLTSFMLCSLCIHVHVHHVSRILRNQIYCIFTQMYTQANPRHLYPCLLYNRNNNREKKTHTANERKRSAEQPNNRKEI